MSAAYAALVARIVQFLRKRCKAMGLCPRFAGPSHCATGGWPYVNGARRTAAPFARDRPPRRGHRGVRHPSDCLPSIYNGSL
ncbi:hypothetical protein GCM10012287_23430 [Streptomyces daqingensis]|uniref:Uncharacterized protein n=1 Tax=Streptomyces daqingensis TaxID=1472640 RepID=A0ABQ2M941_9ACTN|nr:hypothetical protein GCM10012287_23430 [Streptomyces daqingensis]